MTARVVTVRHGEPVTAAVDRMTRFGFSALPVVSETFRLVGMVSLLDVLRYRQAYQAQGVPGVPPDEQVPVEEIMNPDVVSIAATANIAAVAQRLRSQGQLRVMPVVQSGKLVGVLTRGDLLRERYDAGPRGLRRLLQARRRTRITDDDALFALARDQRRPSAGAATPVRDVMTPKVITIGSADPLAQAVELMLAHRHTALPVVDGASRLVGILSEADILTVGSPGAMSGTGPATVGRVMTRTPVTVDAAATVGQARALIADRGLRTVPVLDGDRLVGVLSRSDLL
jgi:CBS domain-containing protein